MNKSFFSLSTLRSPEGNETSGGGAAGDSIVRRNFLKRTGAATVATLIALNTANAIVKTEKGDSNGSAWKIKVDLVDFHQDASGNSDDTGCHWDEQGNQFPSPSSYLPARKTLKLSVIANATPYASSATSAMTVTVIQSAEYVQDPSGPKAEWIWEEMSELQYAAFRPGQPDSHTKAVTLSKSINNSTGAVSTPTPDPSSYSDTVNNILLTLGWTGDQLSITFGSSDIANHTVTTEPVFWKKHFVSPPPEP